MWCGSAVFEHPLDPLALPLIANVSGGEHRFQISVDPGTVLLRYELIEHDVALRQEVMQMRFVCRRQVVPRDYWSDVIFSVGPLEPSNIATLSQRKIGRVDKAVPDRFGRRRVLQEASRDLSETANVIDPERSTTLPHHLTRSRFDPHAQSMDAVLETECVERRAEPASAGPLNGTGEPFSRHAIGERHPILSVDRSLDLAFRELGFGGISPTLDHRQARLSKAAAGQFDMECRRSRGPARPQGEDIVRTNRPVQR